MQVTRQMEFDAGHRVTQHESQCRNVHGHRYRVEVTVEADELDGCGRTVDFGVVKSLVGQWVDDNLDHAYLHHPDDDVAEVLRARGHKLFVVPDGEPTAENIAALLGMVAGALLKPGHPHLRVTRVRVYETPNCWADWAPKGPPVTPPWPSR